MKKRGWRAGVIWVPYARGLLLMQGEGLAVGVSPFEDELFTREFVIDSE